MSLLLPISPAGPVRAATSRRAAALRILQLLRSDSFAGVERYLTYVAPELARRGHHVTVVGGDPARMAPVLGPAGVTHLAAATLSDVIRAAAHAARADRPDVVHTHMTAAEVAGLVTRPVVRRPLVTTRHFAAVRGRDPVTRRMWGLLPRFMAAEIAISHYVSTYVATTAGSPCTVIPNGVPSRPRGSATRRPIVLVAQRFEAEKDTATVVQAWGRSGLADAGWQLHLAGDGTERGQLTELVAELGLADSVTFLGSVDDLERRMDEASVLVASGSVEGFGFSVVEAMASGLPVVAADGGAHPELLGPSASDLLYSPGDPDDLARVLGALVADTDRRFEVADRLRARFEVEYTVERHVDRLEALYQQVTRVNHG